LIADGKNGFLFKVEDEKSLANIINDLKNKEKISKLAKKSVELFNWNRIIEKIDSLIKSKQ